MLPLQRMGEDKEAGDIWDIKYNQQETTWNERKQRRHIR